MVETDFRSNKSKDPIKKLTFSRIKGVRKKRKNLILDGLTV